MNTTPTAKDALLLNFKHDTLSTVSRNALRQLAKTLGFTETQTVHFALARLREEAQRAESEAGDSPLTGAQLAAIRKHEPARRGRILTSLLK